MNLDPEIARGVAEVLRQELASLVRTQGVGELFVVGAPAQSARLRAAFIGAGVHVVALSGPGLADLQAKSDSRQSGRFVRRYGRVMDELDPTHEWPIYGGSQASSTPFCDRRVLGSRSILHHSLERKDAQGSLRGGAMLMRSAGARSTWDEIWRLNLDSAVVIQGIPGIGLTKGSSHTYLMEVGAPSKGLDDIKARLSRDCPVVSISRFQMGTPATLYGFVAPDWSIGLGEFEALVYLDRKTRRVRAFGVRGPMRQFGDWNSAATAVHSFLREHSYFGAYGVDGVLTEGSFKVHEVNPRICAGFVLIDGLLGPSMTSSIADILLRECPEPSSRLRTAIETLAAKVRQSEERVALWDVPHMKGPQRFVSEGRTADQVIAELDRGLRRRGIVPIGVAA